MRVKQGRIIAAERKKRLEQEAKWQAMRAKQAIESKKTTVSTRTDAGPTPPGTRWLVTKGKHPRVNAGSMLAGVFNITKRKPPGYRPPSRWVMMGREPQPPEFDKRKAAICRGNYNGEWVPGSALFYHGGTCLTYWNKNLKVAKEYDVLAPTAKMIASTDKALYPSPIPKTLAWVRSSVKGPILKNAAKIGKTKNGKSLAVCRGKIHSHHNSVPVGWVRPDPNGKSVCVTYLGGTGEYEVLVQKESAKKTSPRTA
ncbi:MAG: DM9 repeat-containing protein [Rhodospirillales bacterium]